MSFLHQHRGGWVSSGRTGGRQRADASAWKATGMSVRSGCRGERRRKKTEESKVEADGAGWGTGRDRCGLASAAGSRDRAAWERPRCGPHKRGGCAGGRTGWPQRTRKKVAVTTRRASRVLAAPLGSGVSAAWEGGGGTLSWEKARMWTSPREGNSVPGSPEGGHAKTAEDITGGLIGAGSWGQMEGQRGVCRMDGRAAGCRLLRAWNSTGGSGAELGKGCAQHLSACMGSPSGPSMVPQEVSQPAGSPTLSGISLPFWSPQLALCVHISEMMTSGGLLSVLSIANLAMGQDLCLVDLCVPTGLRTWQGQRGRSEAAMPRPEVTATSSLSCPLPLPPPHCLSSLMSVETDEHVLLRN